MNKIINKIKKDPEPKSVKEIELNLWKTFLETCTQGRRTGLGITGLGDCLAMLNIKYGSKESIETTESIYKSLAIGAHTSSCVMAKERGAFPLFDYELEKNHAYINSIINSCDKSVKKMWHQSGRRNIALTTTAPTGSVSTLTQTTSGIEPAYLLSYVRRKKINPSEKNAKVDFVDQMGDKWQEFTIYHHGVKQWMDATGEKDITKSPYWGATSNDVDWVASVDLQAAAQKYIDHSISKTCVSKDTLIDTKNGLYYMDELIDFSEKNKTIELSNSDIEVKTHNNVYVKPTYIHTMDNKPIIQLELENGLSIKVSPREQFMYLDEETGLERWKYIEDLSIGDRLKINKL